MRMPILLGFMGVLVACTPGGDEGSQKGETIFDDQMEAHQKAQEIEKQLNDAAKERDKRLREQGG